MCVKYFFANALTFLTLFSVFMFYIFFSTERGESGAGKTESTKKVIKYFAIVAANIYKKGETTKIDSKTQDSPYAVSFWHENKLWNDSLCNNDHRWFFSWFIGICLKELASNHVSVCKLCYTYASIMHIVSDIKDARWNISFDITMTSSKNNKMFVSCCYCHKLSRYVRKYKTAVLVLKKVHQTQAPKSMFHVKTFNYSLRGHSYISSYILLLKDNCIKYMKCLHLNIWYSGESGAGKTENTKKVIMYFAKVAAQLQKPTEEEKEKEVKKVVTYLKTSNRLHETL